MTTLNILDFSDPTIVNQSIDLTLPIYTFNIRSKINKIDLIEKVKLLQSMYPSSTTTNVVCNTGWRSPYFSKYMNNEMSMFSELIDVIKSQLKLINSFDVDTSNIWAINYGKDDYTDWHNHGSLWDKLAYNVVLYLTDSDSPLVIKSGSGVKEIKPEEGMIVVMHPLTYHMVKPVTDMADRIVIAMNFEYV